MQSVADEPLGSFNGYMMQDMVISESLYDMSTLHYEHTQWSVLILYCTVNFLPITPCTPEFQITEEWEIME